MARRQKKYHFIYKTTNTLSGRYYIGMHSTDDLEDGYMGSGTRLKRSLNKYGKENHEIEYLEFLDSRKELKDREVEIVNLNEIAKEECMNLKVGGYGGLSNEEHKRNFIKAGAKAFSDKFKNDPDFREKRLKILANNTKVNVEEGKMVPPSFKDKKHSEETKQKMSESSKGMGKGEANSQYGTCWITNENENKKIAKSDSIPKGWRKGRVMTKK